jgi:diguanylate cyclase (GGDEF)-like protein
MRRDSPRFELAGTSRDPDAVRELRKRLRAMKEAAAKNEVILRKTQARELDLLKAETVPDLLQLIVRGLRESYTLDAVTLVLLDPQHEVRHLLLGNGQRLEDLPEVLFVDTMAELAPALGRLHAPWLGPFGPIAHRRLFPGVRTLQSVALIPLLRQQRAIGALNFGSSDPSRFTRQHGSDFLAHLGIITAVCVENATNRARLLRSGLTDFLTGWHNRRYLQTRLREELARAQRHGTGVSCLLLDVDRFKRVNDSHGHLAGDALLRELTRRVEAHIRASDTAARFGGDEFAVLLPETGHAEAVRLAERIRATVAAKPVDLGAGVQYLLSVSIGVATALPGRGEDLNTLADRLLADADAELYRAKSGGRDRVSAPGR